MLTALVIRCRVGRSKFLPSIGSECELRERLYCAYLKHLVTMKNGCMGHKLFLSTSKTAGPSTSARTANERLRSPHSGHSQRTRPLYYGSWERHYWLVPPQFQSCTLHFPGTSEQSHLASQAPWRLACPVPVKLVSIESTRSPRGPAGASMDPSQIAPPVGRASIAIWPAVLPAQPLRLSASVGIE